MARGNGNELSESAITIEAPLRARRLKWRRLLQTAKRKPVGTVSAAAILVLILVAIFADFLALHDPTSTGPEGALAPPSLRYPMGGDHLGRDIYSNIVYGARLSLAIGIVSVALGKTVGSTLGIVSGYFGGKVDFTLQRFVDAFMAFPTLILAIAIVAFLGNNPINVTIAIAITTMPSTSRVVRGAVLSVKENAYVDAARAIGSSNLRIMAYHVLPNVMAPIIVLASIALGGAILAEASLAFLGLGVPPPTPSWGRMLGGQAINYMVAAPWMLIFPGLAITTVVLAFNLLGDTVRDILDPRLRGGG